MKSLGINNSIKEAQAKYDEQAKKVLSNKKILAHILKGTIEDFQNLDIANIENLIEGEVQVGNVLVDPGLTNKPDVITGLNTENFEENEGLIRFDLIFYVKLPAGLAKIIVNIESQKSEPTTYPILNRAIFYASRMISAQKNREFMHSNFDDLKRVYSIWICMDKELNSISHFKLTQQQLEGNESWKGDLNLFNIIMIGLQSNNVMIESSYNLNYLLNVLFTDSINKSDKLQILKQNYNIEDQNLEKEVNIMCNLGEGVYERGEAQGFERGEARGIDQERVSIVTRLLSQGKSIEEIENLTGYSKSFIIDTKELGMTAMLHLDKF